MYSRRKSSLFLTKALHPQGTTHQPHSPPPLSADTLCFLFLFLLSNAITSLLLSWCTLLSEDGLSPVSYVSWILVYLYMPFNGTQRQSVWASERRRSRWWDSARELVATVYIVGKCPTITLLSTGRPGCGEGEPRFSSWERLFWVTTLTSL